MSTQTNVMPNPGVGLPARPKRHRPELPYGKQLVYQIMLLFIAFITVFPILWVVSLSLDPRSISRPTELNLIPPGASLAAYAKVLDKPTANPGTFGPPAL